MLGTDPKPIAALLLTILVVTPAMATAVLPEQSGNQLDDGDILVGVQGTQWGGKVTALDSSGERLWTFGNATSYHGVSVLDNGNVLAAFAKGDRTGYRIIDPTPNPHIVSQWTYSVESSLNSEVHDVEVLPNGNVLVADMDGESIFVLDRTTEERVWSWNASSFYEAPPDPGKTDWLHINDVDRIANGTYLVSVRNANQLLVVRRGEGVIEVINEDRGGPDTSCTSNDVQLNDRDGDGDVRCGDPAVLDHQHNPQWIGGTPGGNGSARVLVADSENQRVVELERRNGSWEVVWGVTATDGKRLHWPRDADRLPNGNTLITDSKNGRVVEVTPNGTAVRSYEVPQLPYEADVVGVGESVGGVPAPDVGSADGTNGVEGATGPADAPSVIESTIQRAETAILFGIPLPSGVGPGRALALLASFAVAAVVSLLSAFLWWRKRAHAADVTE